VCAVHDNDVGGESPLVRTEGVGDLAKEARVLP
jgi:hypothetical protein